MKRLLTAILAIITVLALASCSKDKGEKITLYAETWEDDGVMLAVDFYYPRNSGIVIDFDEDYPDRADINYESKNITVSPAILEDTTFDENKEYDKENEETFKEFKIGKYNCYGYESFGGYWIYVHLEEVSETTDRYLVIDTEVIDYGKDYTEGIAHYEDKDIKSIIESFEYKGVVAYPEEATE